MFTSFVYCHELAPIHVISLKGASGRFFFHFREVFENVKNI